MVVNVGDWVETKLGNIVLVVARKSRRIISVYNPVDQEFHPDIDVDVLKGCFPAVRRLLKRPPS